MTLSELVGSLSAAMLRRFDPEVAHTLAVAAMQATELGEDAHAARLVEAIYQGDHVRLRVALGAGSEIVSRRPAAGARLPVIGGPAAVAWTWSQALAFG